jgi:hypothetical protein
MNNTFGLNLIGDMTREQLIGEIADIQRGQLDKMTMNQLKSILVDFRASSYRIRLMDEAKFDESDPPSIGREYLH